MSRKRPLFIPAADIHDPLPIAIGLSGGSGTGKTYSALRMARGMAEGLTGKRGEPFGLIDTENRRGLHYAEAFPEMHHMDFRAEDESGELVGFTVARWIEVIEAASASGLRVVVVDSFSHAWAGVGGLLEAHERARDQMAAEAASRSQGGSVDPDKFNMLAWAKVKPDWRRLIDTIIRAKTNFIICTRAKPIMQKGYGPNAKNAFKAKHRMENVPWQPESDSDLMFEMAAMIILDPAQPGHPVHRVKMADQFKPIFDARRPMNEETGLALAAWSMRQGDAQAIKSMMDLARDHARKGKAAFLEFWQSPEATAKRAALKTILPELQAMTEAADREAAEDDSDPFASAPADQGGQSDEEAAAFEAFKREQAEKERAEA